VSVPPVEETVDGILNPTGETGREALRKDRTADVIEAAESVAETFA
jgi:hypothetical protein